MFTGSLCPLCEEECESPYLALGANEQGHVDEEVELKRDYKISSINEEKKEAGTEKAETVAKRFVEMDNYIPHEGAEFETDESNVKMTEENKSLMLLDVGIRNDVRSNLVPSTQEKCMLRLDSSGPVNLVMVCEESVENGVNEELLLCPDKSLTLSQTSLISSPAQNTLPLTLPPDSPPVLQLKTQPVDQTQGSKSMPVPQAPCLTKHSHESSPPVEPETLTHSGKVEVKLQQVYTTRHYTRFTSRSAALKSAHPECSSQPLPCVSNTSLLAPAPKKKTRTSYSTGELMNV